MTADSVAPPDAQDRAPGGAPDPRALVRAFRSHLEWLSLLGVRYVPGGASPRRLPPMEIPPAPPGREPSLDVGALAAAQALGATPREVSRSAAAEDLGAASLARSTGPTPPPDTPPEGRARQDARDLARVGRGAAGLRAIRDLLGDCHRCRLAGERVQIVFGQGDPNADLMFVGEAPGRDEDLSGEPFVGAAGELLTKMIAAMGYERAQVYIGNVIKCRPPRNRDPEPGELAACDPFIRAQIAAVGPRVIVTLGRVAAQALLGTDRPVGRLRGRFHELRIGEETIPLMPTYHPAYLLRSPQAKRPVWEDLKQVIALLRGTAA